MRPSNTKSLILGCAHAYAHNLLKVQYIMQLLVGWLYPYISKTNRSFARNIMAHAIELYLLYLNAAANTAVRVTSTYKHIQFHKQPYGATAGI